MGKVKLTKDELKRQKDSLKRYGKYLPMLELKRRQLQQEVDRIQAGANRLRQEAAGIEAAVSEWAGVFAEEANLEDYFRVKEVLLEEDNIAGVGIPVLREVVFEDTPYDLQRTPLWVDAGIEVCKAQIDRNARLRAAERQLGLLRQELRITIQRINLFEKVKIPEARESVRAIQIFLGDQQTVAVVRGKIAKSNIEKRSRGAVRT